MIEYKVEVIEKSTGEVIETLRVNDKEAMAIFKGYEGDTFYSVRATYIR